MGISGASLIEPFYFLSATIALGLALFFPVTKDFRERGEKKQYYFLQGVTILGAVVGAKLSALVGDYGWPWRGVEDWRMLLSGRSITGALMGGFLAAELAKPLIGYRRPPNDRFAAVLPFSIGIGRIGCALTGCCLGMPHEGVFSVKYADGIARHPAQLYEAAFHFAMGAVFVFAVKRRILFGRLFSAYLVVYGLFRFVTEPMRATPKVWMGFSAYQIFAVAMIFLGGAILWKRTYRPAAEWAEYERAIL